MKDPTAIEEKDENGGDLDSDEEELLK